MKWKQNKLPDSIFIALAPIDHKRLYWLRAMRLSMIKVLRASPLQCQSADKLSPVHRQGVFRKQRSQSKLSILYRHEAIRDI